MSSAGVHAGTEYLGHAQDERRVNLMDYGVPLGRRFRSLKLWFVMRYFGHERMAAIIRSHVAMAQEFAVAGWPRMIDSSYALRCRCRSYASGCAAAMKRTARCMDRVNRTGVAFLSHTVLNGAIRAADGAWESPYDRRG